MIALLAMLAVTASCSADTQGNSSRANNLGIARAFIDAANARNLDLTGPLISPGSNLFDSEEGESLGAADVLSNYSNDGDGGERFDIVDHMETDDTVALKLRDQEDSGNESVIVFKMKGNCIAHIGAF